MPHYLQFSVRQFCYILKFTAVLELNTVVDISKKTFVSFRKCLVTNLLLYASYKEAMHLHCVLPQNIRN